MRTPPPVRYRVTRASSATTVRVPRPASARAARGAAGERPVVTRVTRGRLPEQVDEAGDRGGEPLRPPVDDADRAEEVGDRQRYHRQGPDADFLLHGVPGGHAHAV